MPRISPRLVKQALRHSPLLPPLLRANPNFEQAKLELKWIKNELPKNKWADAVRRRSRLEPLQYILGSQPFGALDILCQRNILIPRWETEEWVLKVSASIQKHHVRDEPLKILDVCTGSGCIPLLMNYELSEVYNIPVDIHAFDISQQAIELSNLNLKKYGNNYSRSSKNVHFTEGDIFNNNDISGKAFNLVLSNPPYIPADDYNSPVSMNGVEKSVRQYEPSLAFIGENEFYEALVKNIVLKLLSQAFVFEVGYIQQVQYVNDLVRKASENWHCGMMNDGAGNVRCVVGWVKDSKMSYLKEICDTIY